MLMQRTLMLLFFLCASADLSIRGEFARMARWVALRRVWWQIPAYPRAPYRVVAHSGFKVILDRETDFVYLAKATIHKQGDMRFFEVEAQGVEPKDIRLEHHSTLRVARNGIAWDFYGPDQGRRGNRSWSYRWIGMWPAWYSPPQNVMISSWASIRSFSGAGSAETALRKATVSAGLAVRCDGLLEI